MLVQVRLYIHTDILKTLTALELLFRDEVLELLDFSIICILVFMV